MRATGRNHRIEVRAPTTTAGPHGGEVTTWTKHATYYAEVLFGTGSERRAAAQDQATAPATFRIPDDAKARAISVTFRIIFDGAEWNITSNVPSRQFGAGREITAYRDLK